MKIINKLDKSIEFQNLYAEANPAPGARPKVPLLQVLGENEGNYDEDHKDDFLLYESLIQSQYVAERFSSCNHQLLMPTRPEDRATIRLFQELCGSKFAYLSLTRSQNLQQLESERLKLQNALVDVDAFLKKATKTHRKCGDNHNDGPYLFGSSHFTLAECNMAPFVQRCCSILPLKDDNKFTTLTFHPLDICNELGLDHLQEWINGIMIRSSVLKTAPPNNELEDKQIKFRKRIKRLIGQEN